MMTPENAYFSNDLHEKGKSAPLASQSASYLKIFVAIFPSTILPAIFKQHQSIAFGIGIVCGVVLQNYLVPPRFGNRAFLILLAVALGVALAAGLVNALLPVH